MPYHRLAGSAHGTGEVIVNLITNTRTSKGLAIQADLEEMTRLNLTAADFHGEWNYSLSPRFKSA